jgi:hypothetical protein
VRQHDPGDPRRVLGLALGQPAELGDGERHRRHRPGPRGPLRRPAELGDERGGLRRRLHVVPQHRRPDDRPGVVDRDHAVLLRRDPDRFRPVKQVAPGGRQRLPPAIRVALGPVRVRRGRRADDRPVVGVDEEHLG